MTTTTLLYLQDMSILSAKARIISIDPVDKTVILDQSPFYPQGGGQPSDKGTLKVDESVAIEVTAVKKDPSGNILHFLSTVEGLECDSEVSCQVDPLTRSLNSRSHSAGHLLDHAVEDLSLPLEVRSAYHFLPCPYVEYAFSDGSIVLSPEYLKSLQASLEIAANKIVDEATPVSVYTGKVSDLSTWRQNLLPETVKQSGSVRLVRFERSGLDPVPCSGTHVTNSAEIKKITVKKISLNKEKRTVRVTYLLS